MPSSSTPSPGTPEEAPLLAIGFWKERLDDDLPLPMEAEGELDSSRREAFVSYLDAGTVVERYRGYSYCRYGCEGTLGSAELSDGVWLWPEGYGHYVRDHGVVPPDQFMEHVQQGATTGQYCVPRPEVDPVCAEIGEACHEAAEAQGEGTTAMECHELEEDTTTTADECEAMRADCEAACADE